MGIYVSVYGPYLTMCTCVCINTCVCVYTERLKRVEFSPLTQEDVFGITDSQSISHKYKGLSPYITTLFKTKI